MAPSLTGLIASENRGEKKSANAPFETLGLSRSNSWRKLEWAIK
jgi:hypothetical protein